MTVSSRDSSSKIKCLKGFITWSWKDQAEGYNDIDHKLVSASGSSKDSPFNGWHWVQTGRLHRFEVAGSPLKETVVQSEAEGVKTTFHWLIRKLLVGLAEKTDYCPSNILLSKLDHNQIKGYFYLKWDCDSPYPVKTDRKNSKVEQCIYVTSFE